MKKYSQNQVCKKNENLRLNKLLYCVECSKNERISKGNEPCKSLTHLEYSILQCPFKKHYDCDWEGHIDNILSHLRRKHYEEYVSDQESYFCNFDGTLDGDLFHKTGLMLIHVNSNLLTLSWSIEKSKGKTVWKGCHINSNMNSDEDFWIKVDINDGSNVDVVCGQSWNVGTINEMMSVCSNILPLGCFQNWNVEISIKPKVELGDFEYCDNNGLWYYLNNAKSSIVLKKCCKSLQGVGKYLQYYTLRKGFTGFYQMKKKWKSVFL